MNSLTLQKLLNKIKPGVLLAEYNSTWILLVLSVIAHQELDCIEIYYLTSFAGVNKTYFYNLDFERFLIINPHE